jgi:O-antigen/teichoic acid export membrane protein
MQYLSTEVYGALQIYLAFSLLVQILVTFSFDTSVYIHFHEFKNDPKKLATFVSSAFIFMVLIGVVIAVFFMITGDVIFKLVLPEKNISFFPYGIASAGAGALQALLKVHSSLLQTREKPETFFWSNVLSFTMIAAFTIVGLELFPNSLMGPIVGRLLAAGVTGLWVGVRIFREFGVQYDFGWLKSSFGFNTYTYIYQLLQWTINYFDRVVMLLVLSLADVGIYVFTTQCLIALELLMNGLHSSFYPKVVSTVMEQSEKESSPSINRYYHGLTAIIMLSACLGIFFLPWLIETFVRKKDYLESMPYLPYLATIYFFRTMRLFFTVPYGILKYTKPLPIVYLVVVALKIVLMLLLMPSLNVYGVVIASLVSSVLEIILLRFSIRDMFKFRFNFFKIVGAPMMLFLIIVTLEPIYGQTFPYLMHASYLVSCAGLLWWAYRKEIQLLNPFQAR